jgi:hypothetical protein
MDNNPGGDFRQSYFIHSKLLSDLFDSDPRLHRAFVSSASFGDLLLRICMTEGSHSEVFMRTLGPGLCPILTLMLNTVKDDMGRETLLTRILVRASDFPEHFAGRFVLRAQQLTSVASLAQAIVNIDALLTCVDLLFSSHTSFLRRYFVQVRYLTDFAIALCEISNDIVADEKNPRRLLCALFRPTYKLLTLVMGETSRAVRNYRDLLSGNFLWIVARIFPCLPLDNDFQIDAAMRLLEILGEYTVYPPVLHAALEDAVPTEDIKKVLRIPKIGPVWKRFWDSFADRVEPVKSMTAACTVGLCDNPSVCLNSHSREGKSFTVGR